MKKATMWALAAAFLSGPVSWAQPIIIDHRCTDLSQVPEYWIRQARNTVKLSYGHTSHGSQLVTGMEALLDTFPVYRYLDDHAYYAWQSGSPAPDTVMSFWDYVPGGDLGNPDWTTWAGLTDTMLSNADSSYAIYPHFRNLVMWSWCGQVSWADSATIAQYLWLMSQLEAAYPGVTFLYMTSHLDGTGASGNLNVRNEQIRAYCLANDKLLFDFADIESYDPDGLVNYMELYANDNCDYDSSGTTVNWAQSWIARNPEHELTRLAAACGECAHSQRLNCILKGRAFWWMAAMVAGWEGPAGVESGWPAAVYASEFAVWPNPARSLSQLRFSRPGRYRIYDALGRLVAESDGQGPVGKRVRAGLYFVREQGGGACRRVAVIR
jgi:hypothetical protein